MPLAWLLAVTLAGAEPAEPTVTITPDGVIEGRLRVAAPLDAVRAVLADAEAVSLLTPDVLSVTVAASAHCERIERETRGLLRPLRFTAVRCPTEAGWRETLAGPGDFSVYETEWFVLAVESGTEIAYRVQARPDLPVPDALIHEHTKKIVRRLLLGVAKRSGDAPEAGGPESAAVTAER